MAPPPGRLDARGHDHGHRAGSLRDMQARALRVALIANGAFVAVEAAGGIAFSSLALLADAAHMMSDVGALAVALVAQRLVSRPTSARHTYGLLRAEVLGAQANGLIMLGASAYIVLEAVRRLGSPVEVDGQGMLAVAAAGLAVNAFSAVILFRARGESLNMRAAFLHMALDAAGSVVAIASGAAIVLAGAMWVDPAASVAIAVLVLWSAWTVLRDTTHVLLEGSPKGMRAQDVEALLASDPEVHDVHHLHLWNLASDTPALSAHVVLSGEPSLHDAQQSGARLRTMLAERFGIAHATIELECHDCGGDDCGPEV